MTTKYNNSICDTFINFKEENIAAKYTEITSLHKILGNNLKGVSVLDIGCGFGYHARWISAEGANVTGIDCSQDQIDIALKFEKKNPLGIKYFVADGARFNHIGQFDVCILMYVLQCANSVQELYDFFASTAENLKPGGRAIGVVNNSYDPEIVGKYGYEFCPTALTLSAGQLMDCGTNFDDAEKRFLLKQIKLDKDLVHEAALKAGFTQIEWINPAVSDEGLQKFGAAFWKNFLTVPVDVYFEIIK